jgi:hypothetical protein
MSNRTGKPQGARQADDARPGPTLDLDRYVPAIITFIANKLSNSATDPVLARRLASAIVRSATGA